MGQERVLTRRAQELLAGPDDARRRVFAPGGLLVNYPEADQVQNVLDELLNQPASSRPCNLLLTGASGNGKSSILEHFLKKWPRRDNPEGDAVEIPVVKVDAPSNKRLMTLYIKLLDQLAAPNIRKVQSASGALALLNQSARQPQIVAEAVLQLLRVCGVRMVIIDEIHSLSKENTEYAKTTLNWIKSIPNECGIPIVLAGEEAAKRIGVDTQLANRFDECTLPLWKWDRRTAQFLVDLEAALPLREPSNLSDKAIATFLMTKGSGTIGSMVRLIEKAGANAVGTTERITLDGLQRAVNDGIRRRLEDYTPERTMVA